MAGLVPTHCLHPLTLLLGRFADMLLYQPLPFSINPHIRLIDNLNTTCQKRSLHSPKPSCPHVFPISRNSNTIHQVASCRNRGIILGYCLFYSLTSNQQVRQTPSSMGIKTSTTGDFPSSPMLKTQHFQCRGHKSVPCSLWELRSHILYGTAKLKEEKNPPTLHPPPCSFTALPGMTGLLASTFLSPGHSPQQLEGWLSSIH